MTLHIQKLRENAVIPQYQTAGAAGADLCACIDEDLEILPGGRAVIPTGIAAYAEDDTQDAVLMIAARSGLAVKRGLTLSNGVGIVDADYRGEIAVGMVHLGTEPIVIHPGDRIAQLLVLPILHPVIREAVSLPDTERGSGGFGSTGMKNGESTQENGSLS